MKIIVTGSLGNISKPLTLELIAKGHDITVISSKTDRQREIEMLGAGSAIGSVTDTDFLSTVFNGADAVYGMTPPNFNAADPIDYYRSVASAYAVAAQNAGVKRFVYLSSYGADLEKGSGMILGSHYGEDILGRVKDIAITFLRPGYFYYNLFNFLGMIRSQGMIGSNFGGDDKLVMVAPLDIAAAAAEELTGPLMQNKVRYIVSDERTCSEVARALGEAIGKPDLQWLTFDDEQVVKAMSERGMPRTSAALLVELGAAIHSGILSRDYEQHKPALAKTKLEDFIPEFVATYNSNQ